MKSVKELKKNLPKAHLPGNWHGCIAVGKNPQPTMLTGISMC